MKVSNRKLASSLNDNATNDIEAPTALDVHRNEITRMRGKSHAAK